MSYTKEVFSQIKEIKDRIDSCKDPIEAIMLQAELLEILKNTFTDERFKKGLIQKSREA